MRGAWGLAAAFVSLALALAACDSLLGIQTLTADGGPGAMGMGDAGDALMLSDAPVAQGRINKVDLLFMIENSASMGDKQALLALAVPQLVQRLVNPNCVGNATMEPTGQTSDDSGNCPVGSTAEFYPVHDLHLGIVTSSLGSFGGDVCPDNAMNPANPSVSAHTNDQGRLINRGGVPDNPTVEFEPGTSDALPLNFLSYFPSVPANAGHPTPPTPAVKASAALIADFTTLVEGVHEHGCGFSSQNEAWYRFLVQPDPNGTLSVTGTNMATLSGIDETILKQRAAFLRPDSLLAIIVVTDKHDRAADPLAVVRQGWAFDQVSFPGSQSGGGAPEGTVQCQNIDPNNPLATGPNDPMCTSCAFLDPSSSSFATECPKDGTSGNAGYLDPVNDAINLRAWHQKERFGLAVGYPASRYIRGLQDSAVPSVGLAFMGDTDHEHDSNGNYLCDPEHDTVSCMNSIQPNCVNPIFAKNLPTSGSSDLCHLETGPRTPDLVYYATIAGVPHQLLQATPGGTGPGEVDSTGNPLCPAGTPQAQCPQKDTPSDADWTLIMGKDPEHYDFRGTDFHMIESDVPRTTNTGLWANVATSTNASGCQLDSTGKAPAGCDPMNGAEWDTSKLVGSPQELEFACTFPLVQLSGGTIQPFQKDCTKSEYNSACDCGSMSLDQGSQACSATTPTLQVNAAAYPSLSSMIIAHAMAKETVNGKASNQGIVTSICPISLDVGRTLAQAQQDPLFGYNPLINGLVGRIKKSLSSM